ncbi:MAG: PH domain-containing protein [Cyanobacteria bacterium P01_A01_bin.84]
MKLNIANKNLKIKFTLKEQLLAVRLHKLWEIPLSNIKQVTTNQPETHWKDVRAPGSSFPGLIRAGTYHTKRGKEFWYVTNNKNYLIIELKNEDYQRIIFTLNENNIWQQQINDLLSGD